VRTIYLSPHLDDAALSAGGHIRAEVDAGIPVEIWTFMAGYPGDLELPEFAQLMHRIWGFSGGVEAVQARRTEDLNAAARLGATAVHFNFLDCIYRRGRQGEALYSDVTVPIQPDDADLPAQLAQAMIAWLRPDDRVVCQLGIGGHVDHVIVRKASEMLHRTIVYIADMPYVLNHPNDLAPSVTGLHGERAPISASEYAAWIEAIECYASQVDSVFGSHEDMRERMRAFWEEQRGIDMWTVPGAS
jgi:LmbE family N-acetylglucosaminyl deacetylase